MRYYSPSATIIAGSQLIEKDSRRAIKLISEGLSHEPNIGEGWFNLGIAYHQERLIDKAIRAYKVALNCREAPIKEIRNNLAQDLLLQGHFKEGWAMYERETKENEKIF